MSNDIKKMNELSDEQLMEIAGGYETAALDKKIIMQPYYGIIITKPGLPIAKYGVQPLYGVKPEVIQPYYGISVQVQK